MALNQLKSYDHLIIKEADKGGCTVVLDAHHYKQICLDLKNKLWYQPTTFEQFDQYMIQFYELVDEAFDDHIINKRIRDFIRTPHLRIPTFFLYAT